MRQAQSEGRQWRLVLLGDVVDFLQVMDRETLGDTRLAPDTSPATTLMRLERIAVGHRDFFAALGRFVAAGFALDIVPGNHDIEFMRPAVQERFKRLVADACGVPAVSDGINFYPWIYYVPGVVYAEHGHQYDANNSFATLVQPFRPGTPDLTELPLGSYFVVYLFNRIERIDPFADNIKPATRYLFWALRTHPVRALTTLSVHASFFVRVLGRTGKASLAEQQQRRDAYRAQALPSIAEATSLPLATLIEIDKGAAIPAMTSKIRQLQALIWQPLLAAIPLLASLWALYRVLQRLQSAARAMVTLSFGLAILAWREQQALKPATDPGGYLLQAALRVDALLRQTQQNVPLYVFGHTHTAEQHPLQNDADTPRYVNTGTWTPIVPQAYDLLGTRERFTFVQITHHPATGEVLGRLMVWEDAAGRTSPLPQFMG